jgi:hypothetical protein
MELVSCTNYVAQNKIDINPEYLNRKMKSYGGMGKKYKCRQTKETKGKLPSKNNNKLLTYTRK